MSVSYLNISIRKLHFPKNCVVEMVFFPIYVFLDFVVEGFRRSL